MSEQQLREMFTIASRVAEDLFAKDGRVIPIWHAVTAGGDEFVLPGLLKDKDTSIAIVRALFEARDVVRYIFIDEAWMIDTRGRASLDDEELARINRDGVASHPDRVEVLLLSGEDSEWGMAMARRRIHRPEERKPYLGPLEWTLENGGLSRIDHLEGRMVGLLPTRGVSQ